MGYKVLKRPRIDIDDFIHKKDEFLRDFEVSFQVGSLGEPVSVFLKEEDITDLDTEAHDIPVEEPIVDSAETFHDEDLTPTLDLLDEDLNLLQEIELIDEDF